MMISSVDEVSQLGISFESFTILQLCSLVKYTTKVNVLLNLSFSVFADPFPVCEDIKISQKENLLLANKLMYYSLVRIPLWSLTKFLLRKCK